jgi:hypothetical protein
LVQGLETSACPPGEDLDDYGGFVYVACGLCLEVDDGVLVLVAGEC